MEICPFTLKSITHLSTATYRLQPLMHWPQKYLAISDYYQLNNPFNFSLSLRSFSFFISSKDFSSLFTNPVNDESSSITLAKSNFASSGFQAPTWAFALLYRAFTLSEIYEKMQLSKTNAGADILNFVTDRWKDTLSREATLSKVFVSILKRSSPTGKKVGAILFLHTR